MPHSRTRKRASGISSWLSGMKKIVLPRRCSEALAMAVRARARGPAVTASKVSSSTPNSSAMALSQRVVPFLAEGERRLDHARAATFERGRGVAEERLEAGEDGVLAHAGRLGAAGGGQDADRADAHLRQKRNRLILDDIRQGTDKEKLARLGSGRTGTMEARQASSPLGERGLDASRNS
jgi:hypothetical protein